MNNIKIIGFPGAQKRKFNEEPFVNNHRKEILKVEETAGNRS